MHQENFRQFNNLLGFNRLVFQEVTKPNPQESDTPQEIKLSDIFPNDKIETINEKALDKGAEFRRKELERAEARRAEREVRETKEYPNGRKSSVADAVKLAEAKGVEIREEQRVERAARTQTGVLEYFAGLFNRWRGKQDPWSQGGDRLAQTDEN